MQTAALFKTKKVPITFWATVFCIWWPFKRGWCVVESDFKIIVKYAIQDMRIISLAKWDKNGLYIAHNLAK